MPSVGISVGRLEIERALRPGEGDGSAGRGEVGGAVAAAEPADDLDRRRGDAFGEGRVQDPRAVLRVGPDLGGRGVRGPVVAARHDPVGLARATAAASRPAPGRRPGDVEPGGELELAPWRRAAGRTPPPPGRPRARTAPPSRRRRCRGIHAGSSFAVPPELWCGRSWRNGRRAVRGTSFPAAAAGDRERQSGRSRCRWGDLTCAPSLGSRAEGHASILARGPAIVNARRSPRSRRSPSIPRRRERCGRR